MYKCCIAISGLTCRKTYNIYVYVCLLNTTYAPVIITFIIPAMSLSVGEAAAFYLQAAIAGIAVIFVVFCVPETFEKPLGSTYNEDYSIKRNLKDLFVGFKNCFFCKNIKCCKTRIDVPHMMEPATPISANAVSS